jgi:SAM-dependent methyltransferase
MPPCNLCGLKYAHPVFSKDTSSIAECPRCGLVSVTPLKSSRLDEIPAIGNLAYDEILYHLSNRVPQDKLLVFGPAVEQLVRSAKREGWKVAERVPKADNVFDACVLAGSLECLPDPRAAIAGVWRVLKSGGLVYIVTPKFTSYESMFLRTELYSFHAAALSKLLTAAGFINVEDLSADTVVVCARKPWLPIDEEHQPSTQPWLEGCLVRRPGDAPEDQMVYYVENGRKRWVTTAEWITAKGLTWPDDVQLITAAELAALRPGPPLS